MFNILVSANNVAWETEHRMRMEASRFGEHSGDEGAHITVEEPESLRALERVQSVLMYEAIVTEPVGEVVRVGNVFDIRVSGGWINFRFKEAGRLVRKSLLEKKIVYKLKISNRIAPIGRSRTVRFRKTF